VASLTPAITSTRIFWAAFIPRGHEKHGVKKIAFPSSTTVLGDATQVPTPESYGPLRPMSLYGGAKVAMEGLLSAYMHTFDMRAWVFRFVDIIGGRIDHEVIHDFIKKLSQDPNQLEILGDATAIRIEVAAINRDVDSHSHWYKRWGRPLPRPRFENRHRISCWPGDARRKYHPSQWPDEGSGARSFTPPRCQSPLRIARVE
jgi:NAD dependent epimerase/dehydratase family